MKKPLDPARDRPDEHSQGLQPLTIGLALGASAGVWLLVELLRRVLG